MNAFFRLATSTPSNPCRAANPGAPDRKPRILSGRIGVAALSAAGLLALAGSAPAADGTWNGSVSNDWQTITNWTPNTLPGNATDVYSATAAATFSTVGSGTINLGDLINIRNIYFAVGSGNANAFTIGDANDTLNLSNAATPGVSGLTLMGTGVSNTEAIGVAGTTIKLSTTASSQYWFMNNSTTVGAKLNIAGNVTTSATSGTSILTLTGSNGGTVSGVISNGATAIMALTRIGTGTWNLSGANTYTGNTTVSGGTLKLDFTAGGAPATNIVSSSSVLKLGGGTLQILGASAGSTQTFASTSFTAATGGQSVISAAPVSGTVPIINLGALTGTQGAMVRFDGAAYNSGASSGTTLGGTTVTATATFNASANTTTGGMIAVQNGALANANNTPMGYATVGLYDWAAISGAAAGAGTTGTIVGASQNAGFYTTTDTLGTGASFGVNWDLTASATMFGNSSSVSGAYGTVRFNTVGAITMQIGRATGNAVLGGILVTPNVGANNTTIAPNGSAPTVTLQASRSTNAATGITIWQNNILGELLITAGYSNGSSSAATASYTQGGAGTVVLGNSNSYTGLTYLNGGTTVISANNNLGLETTAASININGGSILSTSSIALDNGTNFHAINLNGVGGGLAAVAGSTFSIRGVVGSAIGAGPVVIGIPASAANGNVVGLLPGTGSIAGGQTVNTANTTAVFGTGTVALTGANFYTGGTVVKSATVQINGINALGGANYGGLTLDGGTLQYASTLTSASDVSIGGAGLPGGSAVTLAAGGGTIDTNGNNVPLSQTIGNGGSGSLTVKSTAANGVLNLQAANTYTGGTTISSGTLTVSNISGSATGSGAVSLGAATLTGAGFITGATTTTAGSILTPGTVTGGNAGSGTLTLGDLTIAGGTTINFGLSAANSSNNLISAGVLTLPASGTITLKLYDPNTASPFAAAGTYNLFQYTTLAAPNALSSYFTLGTSIAGFTSSFDTSGNFLRLKLTAAGLVANWTNGGGTGTWNNASNWTPGIPMAAGDLATFGSGATPGTVTLDANETAGALTFNNTGGSYTLAGANTLTLNNSGAGTALTVTGTHAIQTLIALNDELTVTVGSGSQMTLSNTISGAHSMTKVGLGTLVLTGNNTYSLGTNINGGILQINSATSLGDVGSTTTINDGTLEALNSITTARNFSLGSSTSTILVDPAATYSIGGVISGAGVLNKTGLGTLALTSTNLYTGGTVINAGSVAINSASSLGDVSGALTINAGTLQTTANIASARNITLGNANSTISTDPATTYTNSGIVSGSGNLNKMGTGTLALNGPNTYSGGTLLSDGTTSLGGGQANGYAGIGSGAIEFRNGGALNLNGYTATDNATSYGTLTNAIFVNAGQTGTIRLPKRTSINSALTGAGTLNIVLDGSRDDFNGNFSAFTGQINFSGGAEARLFNGNGFANAKVNLGAGVNLHQLFNPPTGSGTETVQNIGELSGAVGSVLGGNPVSGRFVNWTVGALGTNSTFAGVIGGGDAGSERLTKVGAGTLTLTGVNTYNGVTTINSGGALQLGDGTNGNDGTIASTSGITNNGTLIYNRFGANSSDRVISGNGAVTKTGAGTQTLTNASNYTGATTVNGGTLEISGSINGTTNVALTNNGSVLLSGPVEAINDAATLTMGAGTSVAFAPTVTGRTETVAGLTLGGGAILDFGALDTNQFALTTGITGLGSFTLSIYNWSGPVGSGTQDVFALNSTLSAAELANINFYSDAGTVGGFLGTASEIAFAGPGPAFQVVPVPEPSSTAMLAAAGFLGVVGFRKRRLAGRSTQFCTRRSNIV